MRPPPISRSTRRSERSATTEGHEAKVLRSNPTTPLRGRRLRRATTSGRRPLTWERGANATPPQKLDGLGRPTSTIATSCACETQSHLPRRRGWIASPLSPANGHYSAGRKTSKTSADATERRHKRRKITARHARRRCATDVVASFLKSTNSNTLAAGPRPPKISRSRFPRAASATRAAAHARACPAIWT